MALNLTQKAYLDLIKMFQHQRFQETDLSNFKDHIHTGDLLKIKANSDNRVKMIIIVWVAGGDLEAVKPKGSFDQWCKRLRHAWGLNSIPWQGDGVPEWAPSLLAQQRSLFPWRILNYVLDQTGRGKTNKTHTHTHVHTPKNPLLFENYCFISYLVCLIKKKIIPRGGEWI